MEGESWSCNEILILDHNAKICLSSVPEVTLLQCAVEREARVPFSHLLWALTLLLAPPISRYPLWGLKVAITSPSWEGVEITAASQIMDPEWFLIHSRELIMPENFVALAIKMKPHKVANRVRSGGLHIPTLSATAVLISPPWRTTPICSITMLIPHITLSIHTNRRMVESEKEEESPRRTKPPLHFPSHAFLPPAHLLPPPLQPERMAAESSHYITPHPSMSMTQDPGVVLDENRTKQAVPTLTHSPPSIRCSSTTPNLTLVVGSKRLKLIGARGLEAIVQVVDMHIIEREALEWVETQVGKS